MCIDYGFDSYCYVKADTSLPPADGWSNTELCEGAPPRLSCTHVAGCRRAVGGLCPYYRLALPLPALASALDTDASHTADLDTAVPWIWLVSLAHTGVPSPLPPANMVPTLA